MSTNSTPTPVKKGATLRLARKMVQVMDWDEKVAWARTQPSPDPRHGDLWTYMQAEARSLINREDAEFLAANAEHRARTSAEYQKDVFDIALGKVTVALYGVVYKSLRKATR